MTTKEEDLLEVSVVEEDVPSARISVGDDNGYPVIICAGSLVNGGRAELVAAVRSCLETRPRMIIIDVEGLEECDERGLETLAFLGTRCLSNGVALALRGPLPSVWEKPLALVP